MKKMFSLACMAIILGSSLTISADCSSGSCGMKKRKDVTEKSSCSTDSCKKNKCSTGSCGAKKV